MHIAFDRWKKFLVQLHSQDSCKTGDFGRDVWSYQYSAIVAAVNLSVPEDVDAKLTKELLDKYDLKAAGSLVRIIVCSSMLVPHTA